MFSLLKITRDYRIKKALSNTYIALAKLQKLFFDNYLKNESLMMQYYPLYKQKIRFLAALQHASYLLNDDLREKCKLIQIERLYEVICSLHLLRFRFTEFSSFEVCAQEMESLQKTSTAVLLNMPKKLLGKSIEKETHDFLNSIHAFETIYSNTLQVISRDPIIFQFFIQDLYALQTLIVDQA